MPIYNRVPSTMMFDPYLVDLLALKEVETDRLTDRQTDGRTFAFLELLSQLKMAVHMSLFPIISLLCENLEVY